MAGAQTSQRRSLQAAGIPGVPGTKIPGVDISRRMDDAFRAEIHLYPSLGGLPDFPEALEPQKKPGDRTRSPMPHGALS